MEKLLIQFLQLATKEKPIPRNTICSLLKTSDRNARGYIERLREKGVRVAYNTAKNGYWITKDEAEYLEFRRNYIAKATTIMKRVKSMDAHTEGQVELNEITQS